MPSQQSAEPDAPLWTRRDWLQATAFYGTAGVLLGTRHPGQPQRSAHPTLMRLGTPAHFAPEQLELWAQQAVEVARAAGAQYAEARLTRTMQQAISADSIRDEVELVGAGVRALVGGAWGFAACPMWASASTDTLAWLAREAVAQAKVSAPTLPRVIEMGIVPAATGIWATPIQIDPFTIPLEERMEACAYWGEYPARFDLEGSANVFSVRQERVLATSDGTHVRQTCYQTGGQIFVSKRQGGSMSVRGLELSGAGWELFQEAKILEQIAAMPDQLPAVEAESQEREKNLAPLNIGRYTLVCDGRTMASILESTLGVATQLDRALGYEADASGTSYLNDPLAMLGHYQVASPLVTVTTNRSAPRQLATVQWDEEGVVPTDVTLIKDGVLVDYQTTRESAAWLAPYYQKTGKPVRSQGCAAAQDATYLPIQHMPNLALAPNPAAVPLADLVADVKGNGLLIQEGFAEVDSRGQTVRLSGLMREIRNGKLGGYVRGGTVLCNALQFWRQVVALGGAPTAVTLHRSASAYPFPINYLGLLTGGLADVAALASRYKGQPVQSSLGRSVSAVAATITSQLLMDATRRI